MVAGVAVILLDGDGARLTDHVAFRRQDVGEGVPIVGVKEAVRYVLDLFVESLEGGSITTADHPGHSSP